MQIEFGHRSKDLSFTASSGALRRLSVTSAAFMLSQPGARSLLRGILAECEHCSYMSVLNRDVNTNGFWQGPGTLVDTLLEQKENKRERGTDGEGGVGFERVSESRKKSRCRSSAGFTRFTTAPSVFATRALQRCQCTTNNHGWILVLCQPA